jgi:hypothetical protein
VGHDASRDGGALSCEGQSIHRDSQHSLDSTVLLYHSSLGSIFLYIPSHVCLPNAKIGMINFKRSYFILCSNVVRYG